MDSHAVVTETCKPRLKKESVPKLHLDRSSRRAVNAATATSPTALLVSTSSDETTSPIRSPAATNFKHPKTCIPASSSAACTPKNVPPAVRSPMLATEYSQRRQNSSLSPLATSATPRHALNDFSATTPRPLGGLHMKPTIRSSRRRNSMFDLEYADNQTGQLRIPSRAASVRETRRSVPLIPLSKNTPRSSRRAVLVAITYARSKGLRLLPASVQHMSAFHQLLTGPMQFRKEDVWVLSDEPASAVGPATHFTPTRANLINAMTWLVTNARKGDNLLFAFCGHGAQLARPGQFDDDLSDDCLLPTDYSSAGTVTDSQVTSILVKNLPPGVNMTILLDCRRSATLVKLPFAYVVRRTSKTTFKFEECLEHIMDWSDGSSMLLESLKGYHRHKKGYQKLKKQAAALEKERLAATFFENGQVLTFCASVSADDAPDALRLLPSGDLLNAFTAGLTEAVREKKPVKLRALLSSMASEIGSKRDMQLPLVSSSQAFRLDNIVPLV